ncbi:hypothetical protein R1sor_018799 [Riccia sorocarpa]|uniref:Uncharacterized protein n=1 Tax=Riccia sorocarpa TaxID=122646 RepID=A0ABD3IDF5_9MARC
MANNSHSHSMGPAIGPAIGPSLRDRSPDARMGRSGCCGGFLRLGAGKRGRKIVPNTREGSASSSRVWATNGAPQSGTSQYASLSPSLLAPPSSPASFQNSAVQSSAQSPSTYSVSLAAPSCNSQIPLESTATMFQMGPYAHETALVSPPVFSTFTTAPSTAPFTPPPELATHVTTPSSPDVPFAKLLASSFETKGPVRQQPPPPPETYSAAPFASPDIFPADDLHHLYPGSPLAHLLSPNSGTGQSTPFPELDLSSPSPFPDHENPVQTVATMFFPGSPLVGLESSATMELGVESLLLSEALNPPFEERNIEERRPLKSQVALEQGHEDPSKLEVSSPSRHLSWGRSSSDGNLFSGKSYDVTLAACRSGENSARSDRDFRTGTVRGHATVVGDEETDVCRGEERSLSGSSKLGDWKHKRDRVLCEARDSSSVETFSSGETGNRECTSHQDTHEAVSFAPVALGREDPEASSSSEWPNPGKIQGFKRVQNSSGPSASKVDYIPELVSAFSTSHVGDSASCGRTTEDSGPPWSCSPAEVSEQLPSAGQKLSEQSVCGETDKRNCCGRCDELETRCDELTEALKQATQKLANVEVQERVALYREQQFDALMGWVQSGTKAHQNCVGGMSEHISEVRHTNWGRGFRQSCSRFSGICDAPDNAGCIASDLVSLETKIKDVDENISAGDPGLRSDNSLAMSLVSA